MNKNTKPEVTPEKIKLEMSRETDELFPALFEVKGVLEAVTKKSDNPFFKSSYADLNEHLDTVEPVLKKYGLMLLQPPGANSTGNYLHTLIVHADSGQWISATIKIPNSITDSQKIGAAITYFRRFAINSMLSLKTKDDDGNSINKKKNKDKSSFKKKRSNSDDF